MLPPLIRQMAAFNRYVGEDFLGGPKLIKQAWVVNLQKGATLPFVAALMFAFHDTSAAAWVYLALHGSYGLLWLGKHLTFPDPNWEKRVTFGSAFVAFALVLGPYWFAPILLITNVLPVRPDPSWLTLCAAIIIYALGAAIMLVSDAQKYFTLKVRRGLIQDGMFKYVRHPNYLGEMMIYGSFALIVGHWLPWAVLAWVWTELFLVNMLTKEASMSRYPEWAAYKARTGMLLPWPLGASKAPAHAEA